MNDKNVRLIKPGQKEQQPEAPKTKYKVGHIIELSNVSPRLIMQVIFLPGQMVQGPDGTLMKVCPDEKYCVQISGMAQPAFPDYKWIDDNSNLITDFGFK